MNGNNHGDLCSIFLTYQNAPRGMRQYGMDYFESAGRALQDRIKAEIADHRPHTLILSSEWFARLYDAPDAEGMMTFLRSLDAKSCDVVIYARRPSEFYLSASQQRLRASSLFEPIFEWRLPEMVAGFERHFGSDAVKVSTFDREKLAGGDIVIDFATHFVPDSLSVLEHAVRRKRPNQSLSAEAMVVLQDYRRRFFSDAEDQFNRRTRRVIHALKKIDAAHGDPRPRLKQEWADFFDYGDDRALLLRDAYGVNFSEFDYARLEAGQFPARPENNGLVADQVVVDEIRLAQVIEELAFSNWSRTFSSARWIKDLALCMTGQGKASLPLWRRIMAI
jgi:hypothetical protein